MLLSYFFLFNPTFAETAKKSKIWGIIRNQGVVPAQLFAIILVSILLKESPMPQIQWGIAPANFGFVAEHFTIFGLGMPAVNFFLSAIPMALTVYIIAFSDFVLAKEVVEEATAGRPDETVIFDAGRSNLVSFCRNAIMALFTPWVPLWASGLLTITERYKRGYKTMNSHWDGVCTFRTSTVIAVMILPLVTLIRPAFAIFFGIRMTSTANERGIACVIAGALACMTLEKALLVGIIVWAVAEGPSAIMRKKEAA